MVDDNIPISLIDPQGVLSVMACLQQWLNLLQCCRDEFCESNAAFRCHLAVVWMDRIHLLQESD